MVTSRVLGSVPELWSYGLKSPDRVRSDPRSYRGISLLPVLGKVLERIMVARLKDCYSEGTSLYQFGFTEGRGTVDAWRLCKIA